MKFYYNDPPYRDTIGYEKGNKNTFNHDEYYKWLREKVKNGDFVLCSEYYMPDDFICIYTKELSNGMSRPKNGHRTKNTEKLFIHESQKDIFENSFPDWDYPDAV
jgi:DNA adenine methylase